MFKTIGTHNYYVYMLTNRGKTVLYTGMTNNLVDRIRYHRENVNLNRRSFTSKYWCFYLIYFEQFDDVQTAINREKEIKGWTRVKKEELIKNFNPDWRFLNNEILDPSFYSE